MSVVTKHSIVKIKVKQNILRKPVRCFEHFIEVWNGMWIQGVLMRKYLHFECWVEIFEYITRHY